MRTRVILAISLILFAQPAYGQGATGSVSTGDEVFRADLTLRMTELIKPADGQMLSTFSGRCSRPSSWVISFALEGESTPLGKVTGWAEHCSQVITWKQANGQNAPDSVRYSDGRATIATIAGDTVYGVYGNGVGGTRTDGTIWFDDDFAIMGGTGRFDLASGNGREVGTFTPGKSSVMYLEGTIRYRSPRPQLRSAR